MLVAIIWGLVIVAGASLAIGFFISSSNVWLILAIVFAIAAIVLVLGSWARRARETSSSIFDETISFGGEDEGGEEDDEELYSALDTDTAEEFAVGSRRDRSARRPAARKSGATPSRKPKAKPKATSKAKPAASKSTTSRAKSTGSKSTAKRKPAAKPTRRSDSGGAKAKPTSRPKAKPPRRRPQQ